MILKYKRRSQNEVLVWILFSGPFLIAPLMQFFKFPEIFKYILDATWLFLLLTMIIKRKRKIDSGSKKLLNWIIAFAIFTLINYLLHFQSIFYYLWGFRNNFRGYVLFFAVIYYFREENINEVLLLLKKLFYINAIVMLIQFFALGYKQDNLGGIFGVESGCNAYVNLFFCIILVVSFIKYCDKKESLRETLLQIVLMLVLAATAELKFFYIEFIIIIAIGFLITSFSWKKLIMVLGAVIAIGIGYRVFLSVFPDIDLSIAGMTEYAISDKGYTSSGDLNRFNFLSTINTKFLPGMINQIFGLGLGNCDYATGVELVSSPFYYMYEKYHYAWMSTTFMYLENGWIGLIFFFGFFVFVCTQSLSAMKQASYNKTFSRIAFLCGIVAIMNGFYNISLRIESGYMLYFMLAIPWCAMDKIERANGEIQ